jgi:hypothetical protein
MKSVSADTSPEAERVLLEAYRRMSPEQKLKRAFGLTLALRELTAAAIRQERPNASEREIQLRVASRSIPRELMIQAFGWDPEVEGY